MGKVTITILVMRTIKSTSSVRFVTGIHCLCPVLLPLPVHLCLCLPLSASTLCAFLCKPLYLAACRPACQDGYLPINL